MTTCVDSTSLEADNTGSVMTQLEFDFDAAGNRTALRAAIHNGSSYDDDLENTYTYDALHRLTRLDQAGQSGGNVVAEKRVDFAYNATGQFTDIDRFKDLDGGSTHHVVETDFVYDGLGRLTDLTHTHDTTTIADYGWTFDSYSRVTQMSFTSSTGNSGTSDYSYDDTGQVTAADHDFQTDESYSYDENGNRTLTGYTTGDNNQLTSDGTFNYTYDDEGNRLTRTRISGTADDYTTEYEWDHDNRLTKLTYKNNSSTITKEIEYGYDLFGRRISKTIDWDGAGSGSAEEVHYIYDGDDILLAFDGDGDLTNRYLHGPAVDQILADEQVTSLTSAGDVLWPLADNLGSVRDIVDSTGAVENHLTYDSFGNVTSETDDTVDHTYAYTGRDRDEESDLQYNRARYYDASVGRWISEDPIGFAAGDTNLARYVGNDAIGRVDPSGLLEAPRPEGYVRVEPKLPLPPGVVGLHGEGDVLVVELERAETAAKGNGILSFIFSLIWPDELARESKLEEELQDKAIDQYLSELFSDPAHADIVGGFKRVRMLRAGSAIRDIKALAEGDIEVSAFGLGGGFLTGGSIVDDLGRSQADDGARGIGGSVGRKAPRTGRPSVNTSLPGRVTGELPPGQVRTAAENAQARNFFKNNRAKAEKWWSDRNGGKPWPENATHAEHPRPLADGGDPLFIEPGFDGPASPHMNPGPDGLTDFQRWGRLGGRPRSQ